MIGNYKIQWNPKKIKTIWKKPQEQQTKINKNINKFQK